MSKHRSWFPPEAHIDTGRLCSAGSGGQPRSPTSTLLFGPPTPSSPSSACSGYPCRPPTSVPALVLRPCRPAARAPAYELRVGDCCPAPRVAGSFLRRNEVLPGSWVVLFLRAV